MKHLKALVLMQLKDKIDLSFTRTPKEFIRKIIFTILKFAAVLAVTYVVRFLLNSIIFFHADTPQIMIVLMTFLLGFSFLSCTVGLVKSLYFAADNRVLITFPVGNNIIFISKLIVYYIYELGKECLFILPVMLGCGLVSIGILTPWFIPWTMLMMVFVPAVPVLMGGLLSIPALYIARIANRYTVLKVGLFAAVVAACVYAVVKVISLLPEDIDLINQGDQLIRSIKNFLMKFEEAVPVASWLIYLFIGQIKPDLTYNVFAPRTFIILAGLICVIAVLFGLVYLVSRPLFFKMMSKSFEFEKKITDKSKLNKPHSKWYAFTLKEFKLCILNVEVSLSFIAVYVAVPLLIYLLNSLYAAMNTALKGDVMAWAFNLLIMMLPMLASNSVIATLYSKEGRAGYIKKTEPVNILLPLIAKIFFFLLLSVPSIFATVFVFGSFTAAFKWYDLLFLGLMLLFFQYGHIFYSALVDIMNPQNEQYATVGDSAQNPNESKSTLVAFGLSAFVALFGFILLSETTLLDGTVTKPMVKLMLIGGAFMGVMIGLFIKNIKAFYYEK